MTGHILEPTIVVDVHRKARIAQEEIFGPVPAVIKARNFDDAREIANNTEFGLIGEFFTPDREKIEKGKNTFTWETCT